MQAIRLLSRTFVSKTSVFSRTFRLHHTTGSPIRCLSILFHPIKSKVCKYPSLNIHNCELLSSKIAVNYTTSGKAAVKNHSHLGSVQKLLDLYVTTGEGRPSLLALTTLDSIVKCTRKSAKEANNLLQDLDTLNKFECLLKDVEVTLDKTPDIKSLVSVLSSLAEIFAREKVFLNQTGIDIYQGNGTVAVRSMVKNHVTSSNFIKTQESHEPVMKTQEAHEPVISLFLKYKSLILSKIDCVSSKELVNILWCYAETGCGNKQFYEELWDRFLGLPTMELRNEDIAKVICSFAKLKLTVHLADIMSKMEEQILQRGISSLRKEDTVDVLFSFASVGHGSKKLYQDILSQIFDADARTFIPIEICKILWCFTIVSNKQLSNLSDLFNRFENEISRRGVKRFDIQGLAVITWCFVETPYFSKRLFSLLRHEITRRNIKYFSAGNLSIFLKSFAKVKNRMNANKFFSKVDKELLGRGLALFTNRHLASTLWSFAETGNGTPAFYDMMKREIIKRSPRQLTPVEFSQVIWSIAKSKEKVNVEDFLVQVDYDVTRLSLRQLSLVLWSYAITDVVHVELIMNLNREICKQDLTKANYPMTCQIMYGLATFKQVTPPEKVVQFFEKSIIKNGVKLYENRQLAVLVWSFCELHQFCEATRIYDIFGREICSRFTQEFMPSDLCRLLWGLAQVNHFTDTTITFQLLTKELLRKGLGEFSNEQVTMAAVAMSTANQWNAELVQLFEREIVHQRNARSFDGRHLCSLAKSFLKMNPLDSAKLFCWLEEEILCRNVNNFCPKDLTEILQILLDRRATKLDFFVTVKDQLLTSNFKNYSKEDISNVCTFLGRAGINSQDF